MIKQKILMICIVLVSLLMTVPCYSATDYSIQLNGTSQSINCGSSSDFNFTNALTLEAWIYPTDFKEEIYMNTIVARTSWDPNSYGWSFRYGSSSGSLNFNMSGGGLSWVDCIANNVLTLNTWQHVAATYDGIDMKLYVNGILVATQNFPGTIINSSNDLCIGTINSPVDWDMRYMAGKIDDVRIWNFVRTDFQIFSNMSQFVSSPNLVAYYLMADGRLSTLHDNTRNGHTATLIGSPTWVTEQPREYSLGLNGSSQYAEHGNLSSFNFTNQLTLEAWIRPNNFKETMYSNTIIAKTLWTPNACYGWSLSYGSSNGTLNFRMSVGGTTWIDCVADSVLTLYTWHHVAATYNGSAIFLYVNGVQVATQNAAGSIVNANRCLSIGATNNYDMRLMQGLIDEVRIWNVARSESEIRENMGYCEVSDNLLAYYRMTNGIGSYITDNSGHGFVLRTYGNPSWGTLYPYYIYPIVRTDSVITTGSLLEYAAVYGCILWPGINPVEYGHCWRIGASTVPTIYDSRTDLGVPGSTIVYVSNMSGLGGNVYSVRAYIYSEFGTSFYISYGKVVNYIPLEPPSRPIAMAVGSVTSSGFTATWQGLPFYIPPDPYHPYYQYMEYNFLIDVSKFSDFRSYVIGYRNLHCGLNGASLNTTNHSFCVTGLEEATQYYYRIRSSYNGTGPYSATIAVTTLATYNISHNTGNINGVRIYTADTDYGIDPVSPLIIDQGYSGTILAEKDGYTWSLADGSDSNVITNLSSNRDISFIGTYRFVDPANPDFVYLGEPDVPIYAEIFPLEDIAAAPPIDPADAMILLLSGTVAGDITISVPSGTWYAVAYYDDPAEGGLIWHHANPYPAVYPENIVFSDLPFGAKSNIPVVLGSQETTLPVELSSFTAVAMGTNSVNLHWVTQSETNLMGFVVYRNDSSLFASATSACSLIPATNSTQTTEYSLQDSGNLTEGLYFYWLQILELNGSLTNHGPISVEAGHPAGYNSPDVPLNTRLLPSYPNPFNPSTTILYELKTPENVSFTIYNCKGQIVATHRQNHDTAGRYSWVFTGMDKNGNTISNGVYFCVMKTVKDVFTNKMVLMK